MVFDLGCLEIVLGGGPSSSVIHKEDLRPLASRTSSLHAWGPVGTVESHTCHQKSGRVGHLGSPEDVGTHMQSPDAQSGLACEVGVPSVSFRASTLRIPRLQFSHCGWAMCRCSPFFWGVSPEQAAPGDSVRTFRVGLEVLQ